MVEPVFTSSLEEEDELNLLDGIDVGDARGDARGPSNLILEKPSLPFDGLEKTGEKVLRNSI